MQASLPKGTSLRWLATAVTLGLLVLSMVGCARLSIVEEPAERGQAIPAAAQLELHDVAVTAVEFDPPLGASKALSADRPSLLVVVENKGNQPESRLLVESRLSYESGESPLVVLEMTVDQVVPGESRVVRFRNLPAVAAGASYYLEVAVGPVPLESLTQDNTRSFRIQASDAR